MVPRLSLWDFGLPELMVGDAGRERDGERELADGERSEMSSGAGLRRVVAQVVGVAWVIGAALLTLAPALHHGLSLGSYDILSQSGLTRVSGVTVRNTVSGDQIAEMIPWSTQAWTQVHQGHLPLWNPSSGLGLPLAFNWQSGVFSLPSLIGYIFPLHLAYTAQIITTLVIAGTGAYVLARTLRVGVLGCATAGTVFELSGSFMGWLGWPHAAVMSLAPWLFAVAILIMRGRNRTRNIVAFAVLFALAVYAGEPEIFAILLVSLAILVLTVLVMKHRTERDQQHSLRSLVDLSVASLAGAALSAPLLLPGLQVLARSTRSNSTFLDATEVGRSLPPHDLVHLLTQGYNGLPIAGNQVFGDAVYTDTAAYVGLISVALAVLGFVRYKRRPETVAFAVLGVVSLAIVYAPPVEAIFVRLPLVKTVDWHRDLMMVGLCFAIMAGLGMDALVRTSTRRSTQFILAGVLAGGLVLLLLLWLLGTSGLTQLDAGLRRDSFKWPLATGGLALVVLAALWAWTSRGGARQVGDADGVTNQVVVPGPTGDPIDGMRSEFRRPSAGQVTGVLLLLLESAFLVVSGAQLWSSSPQGATATPAVQALERAVGGSTVGFGAFTCYLGPGLSTLGVLPESNILFGVHEFDFYDPILPRGYLQSWAELSKNNPAVLIYNSFCPALTSASEARRYGVKFVLEPHGGAKPTGAVFDERIGPEDLYRIPDSGEAVLVPPASMGGFPAADASGTPVAVDHPTPSTVKITTSNPRDQVLRLRLTDEPGWHATIDGRPLALEPFADVMLQARIPAGRHVIQLRYWPTLFTVGLITAAVCVLLLILLIVTSALHRRHRAARSI
jgi:hypothetical protein